MFSIFACVLSVLSLWESAILMQRCSGCGLLHRNRKKKATSHCIVRAHSPHRQKLSGKKKIFLILHWLVSSKYLCTPETKSKEQYWIFEPLSGTTLKTYMIVATAKEHFSKLSSVNIVCNECRLKLSLSLKKKKAYVHMIYTQHWHIWASFKMDWGEVENCPGLWQSNLSKNSF